METNVIQKVRQLAKLALFSGCFLLAPVSYASEGNILVFQPVGNAFEEVSKAIRDDMSEELAIHVVPMDESKNDNFLADQIKATQADAVVLLGNHAVNLFSSLQQKQGAEQLPPAVVTAALFVDQMMPKLSNTIAIAYEVPLVTSLVNTRTALSSPVSKVGLIYRAQLDKQMQAQVAFCEAEGIAVEVEQLPDNSINMDKKVSKALKRLIRKDVDAFLVLNDNGLLTSKTMKKAWIPVLSKQKKPVIVGIDSLLTNELNLGSFFMAPDHYGLGQQTASYLWELLDNDWVVEENAVVQPLSVKKKINLSVLERKKLPLAEGATGSFDEVIE